MNKDFNSPEEELEYRKKEFLEEFNRKRKGCIGCLSFLLVIFAIILCCMIYVSKLPCFEPAMTCVEQEMELYNAIMRYRDLNNAYPKSLDDIKDEYLKDKNILFCPLDTKHEGYEYFCPDKDKNTAFILRCNRHKISDSQPLPPFAITKQGQFSYDFQTFQEKK